MILGKVNGRFLRDVNRESSVLVFARQGAGKGVGPVISNLLDYKGSVLVTDPKGENFAITARHRRALGPVYRLGVSEPELSDSFNPISSIRWGSVHEPDDAEVLADLMLVHNGAGEQHWRDKAKSWVTGFILYVGHFDEDQPELVTLAQVNDLVNGNPDSFLATVEDIAACASPKCKPDWFIGAADSRSR